MARSVTQFPSAFKKAHYKPIFQIRHPAQDGKAVTTIYILQQLQKSTLQTHFSDPTSCPERKGSYNNLHSTTITISQGLKRANLYVTSQLFVGVHDC